MSPGSIEISSFTIATQAFEVSHSFSYFLCPIKVISENLDEEKFDNFLQDLIEQVNNLKLESKLKDAEESLSKNMNEAQYNELLSLKDQIVASKKV